MQRNLRRDARRATIFATLVCAWVLGLSAINLAPPLRDHSTATSAAAVLTAGALR